MAQRRRKRGFTLDRRLLILFSIMPVGCLLAIFVGLIVAWYLAPTRFVNAGVSDLSEDYADEVVIMAAADFAEHEDIGRARELLTGLNVPNQAQYVSLVAERMIRTNRGPVDDDIKNVVQLADALGVSTVSMIAYVSPPTFTPTSPPPPTPTPTNTQVIAPTETAEPTLVVAEAAEVAEDEEPTPTEEPLATDTPIPATNTPAPPTNTPEPTATPEPAATPVPDIDYIITKQRLLTKAENGGCLGNHSIFTTVIDAAGNPIKGVELGDVWGNPGPTTGHKGDDNPGLAVQDLYKNGFKIFVVNDPTAGRPVTSQVTELLSSNDWEVGIPNLIEGGYCPDESTCRVLWNSGTFGEGNNSLCWGHYSWEVVFQRTW